LGRRRLYSALHGAGFPRSGAETLVNQTTAGTQKTADISGKQIASDSSGNFVVIWEDTSSGTSEVFARKFAADGTALTAEFQVSAATGNGHDTPTVAMDANGAFVAAWRAANDDGDGYGIYAQRYNAIVAQGAFGSIPPPQATRFRPSP
jgi:hypothetical protein